MSVVGIDYEIQQYHWGTLSRRKGKAKRNNGQAIPRTDRPMVLYRAAYGFLR